MSLRPYAEYKDSGVAWLGEVPVHWRIVRLRDIATVFNGYPFNSALFTESSGYPLIRIRDLDSATTATKYSGEYIKAAEVTRSDILIGMDGDFNVGYWLGSEPALLNQRMCCVRIGDLALSSLIRNSLPIPLKAINDVTYSTTVKHLSSLDVEKIKFALPDKDELLSIATFTDSETAKIDALIAEQEKLIALLAEKRQAVISHAVTKGLNPDAPMKDSGIAWLGEVPAHWETSPLRYLAKIGNGSTPSRDNPDYWAEEGFPWLNSSVVNQEEVTESDQFVTEFALKECHLPVISPPTMLLGITGQGKTRGMATKLGFKATINQHLAYISPNIDVLSEDFLLRVLESAYENLRTESDSVGSTKGAITCDQISRFQIPLPSLEEQDRIVIHLNEAIQKLDALSHDVGVAITLLKERRSALISAAVTGKIDVRNWQPEASAA
ncbi:restriction endonuclease subunit S [Paludibacterium paludis]|uniref:Type I restriction-modification protein subunit S n=1 Tax=Paludibacterium paludis TaxID=1225769 RepID=A0A918UBF4_9NEIS|nr:restriction endonuclease subunit S [Paludibacterium paludis]GGY21865.1 type I restriction-modification protein subunit S [Paludibacterium paludis]